MLVLIRYGLSKSHRGIKSNHLNKILPKKGNDRGKRRPDDSALTCKKTTLHCIVTIRHRLNLTLSFFARNFIKFQLYLLGFSENFC
jgi:hypothetical protein